jgi:hypothetical protein
MAKSKLTDKRHMIIVEAIKKGNFGSTAASLAGISERSYWRYLQQGEEAAPIIEEWNDLIEDWNSLTDKQKIKNQHLKPSEKNQPNPDQIAKWLFWQDIKKAEAEAEAEALNIIHQIAKEGTFQAAAWYLERKFPSKWGRQDKSTVTYQGNIEHNHTLSSGPSEKEIEAAKEKLAQARQITSGNSLLDNLNNLDQKDQTDKEEVIDAEVVDED